MRKKITGCIIDYEFKSGFEFSIHKYIGCGESLFLTCYDYGFNKYDLNTKDINEAEKLSVELLKDRAEQMKNAVDSMCTEMDNYFSLENQDKESAK